ncbi:MAG: calcium-binding EGF-like domain-containing protein [Chitinophagaceae bacterium]|nr:calcium-binding EGF-like domain-containing protein [Chitinophagaceae bacterium]
MKRLSLIAGTFLVFMSICSLVLFNACNHDACKNLVCKNNGVCRDERCKCANGFEGVNCETKVYEKFIGTYDGKYRCNGIAEVTITNIISPGDQPNKITIHDIFAIGLLTNATIDLEHTEKIELESQTVGNYTYEGNGYINGRYLTIFVMQKNNTDNTYNSCVYNAIKYIKP